MILAEKENAFGMALNRAAKKRGLRTLVLSTTDLVRDLMLSFSLTDEEYSLLIDYQGLKVRHFDLKGVYCAISSFEPDLWQHFDRKDARFAAAETQALWLSILSGLECTVINPPGLESLAGTALSIPETLKLASRVGFSIPTVSDVESGDVAADIIDRTGRVQYLDLGETWGGLKHRAPESGRNLRKNRNHFRLLEKLPGRHCYITLVGSSFWACEVNELQKTVVPRQEISGDLKKRLISLQSLLNLNLAEYAFCLTRQGEWIFEGYERLPSIGPSVYGEDLMEQVVDFAAGKG